MIKITTAEWKQNPNHIQNLAQTAPILITDGDKKQVLMNYDEYKKLAKADDEKPFVSAYDTYIQIMSDFSPEQLEALANVDIEFDMSFLEK